MSQPARSIYLWDEQAPERPLCASVGGGVLQFSLTVLQSYSWVLQSYSHTVLQSYSLTVLQSYSLTVLQSYSVTVLQLTLQYRQEEDGTFGLGKIDDTGPRLLWQF